MGVRSAEEDVWGEITTWMDLTLVGWRAFDQATHLLLPKKNYRDEFDRGHSEYHLLAATALNVCKIANLSVIGRKVISDHVDDGDGDDGDENVSAVDCTTRA